MYPDYWQQACEELSKADPVMASIIAAYPGELLSTRGDAFYSLARSIVGQQVSVKAAASMWTKFEALCQKVEPQIVVLHTPEALRECGLSRQKISYLQNLAEHFLSKELEPSVFPEMTDEEIINVLVKVKGIGRWTAEMFLIFHLLRPNLLPVDDIGLLNAVKNNYPHAKIELGKPWKIADKWQPWRTVATWYLWRSLDPIPVEY